MTTNSQRIDALEAWRTSLIAEMTKNDLANRMDKVEAKVFGITTTPPPVVDPPPVVTPPPPPATTIPMSKDDPRFANNTNGGYNLSSNGTPSNPQIWRNLDFTRIDLDGWTNQPVRWSCYQAINCRFLAIREGPRVAEGGNVLIDGCYITVYGRDGDHADGIQGYSGRPGNPIAPNVVIRNTFIQTLGGDKRDGVGPASGFSNAGIYFADYANADVTLENVYVDGSAGTGQVGYNNAMNGSANGAVWFLNDASKGNGCNSLSLRNVTLVNQWRPIADWQARGGKKIIIKDWVNVIADGKPVPKPDWA